MPRPVRIASSQAVLEAFGMWQDRTWSGLHLTTLQDAARWFKMVPTSQVKNGLHCIACFMVGRGWPWIDPENGTVARTFVMCNAYKQPHPNQWAISAGWLPERMPETQKGQQLPFSKKGSCSYLRHWSGDVCFSEIDGNILLAALATCSQLIHHLWWFGCRRRCRRKDLHTLQASCGQKV